MPQARRLIESYIDRRWPCVRGGVVARTGLIDETVAAELARVRQVLILGAGFDSRAYRLPRMREARVFEVDHPDTQAAKQRILRRRGQFPANVTFVPVVFGTDDPAARLGGAGFETGVPTLVLWEGVTNYLDPEAVDSTFAFLAAAVGPGSPVLFTYVDRGMLDGTASFEGAATTMRAVRRVGEPLTFGMVPREVPGYLAGRGFTPEWDVAVSDAATRLYPAGALPERPRLLPRRRVEKELREGTEMPRVDDSYLESRRRQIMDAAITCFARDGFHRTTMQDIVAQTGLSAGAIYRYFPSKEDIVAAIATEHRTAESAAFSAVTTSDDVGDALRLLAQDTLGRLAEPDEQRWRRVTVQVWGEALRNDRVMDIVRDGLHEPIKILTELFRHGRGTASCRPGSTRRAPRASAPRSSRAWSCSRPGTRSLTSTPTSAPSSP